MLPAPQDQPRQKGKNLAVVGREEGMVEDDVEETKVGDFEVEATERVGEVMGEI